MSDNDKSSKRDIADIAKDNTTKERFKVADSSTTTNKQVIGAYDAKTRLPEILRQVSQGQSFTVTNRGQAVAEITPTYLTEAKKVQVAINNILNMEKTTVTDETLTELKKEGRK